MVFLAVLLACTPAKEENSSLGLGGGGGGGSSGSIYQQFCEQLDECNLLTGMSVTECASDYETAVESCSGTETEDWATDVTACISEYGSSCSSFESCLYDSYTWGCWGY